MMLNAKPLTEHLLEDLSQASEGDVVLYTVAATIQPVLTQLLNNGEISRTFSKNGWLPLFDFAYQGFSKWQTKMLMVYVLLRQIIRIISGELIL